MDNADTNPQMPPSSGLINRVLAERYELLETLGTGPLLTAFRSRDKIANRVVTVKVMQTEWNGRADILSLLQTGLSQSAGLDYPAIIRVFEIGSDHENEVLLFIAEEFVRGIDLKERIRRAAPFQLSAAVDTALILAECLEFAHNRGIFHGDVRPQNVLVGPDNQVKLSGFGIAAAQNKAASKNPEPMQRLLLYAAPELSFSNTPTASADLYALGVVLFEMLTGDVPFKGENAVQIALKHAQNPVPSPKQMNAAVPRALDGLVQKMLAKQPENRYADMGALLKDLRLVRDALRYGRPLSWSPLDADRASAPADEPKTVPVVPMPPAAAPVSLPPAKNPDPVPFDPYRNDSAPEPFPTPAPLAPVAPRAPVAPEDETRVMPISGGPRRPPTPPIVAAAAPTVAAALPVAAAPPPIPIPTPLASAPAAPRARTFAEPAPGTYVLTDPAPQRFGDDETIPKDGRRSDKRIRRAGDKEPKEPPVYQRASRALTTLNIFFIFLIVAGIGALAYASMNVFRTPVDVVVPNLVGKSVAEAQSTAASQKFEVAQVDAQYRDKEPADTIYQMSPPPGRHIREGRSVEIWVSKGPRMVDVPDVRDVSLEKARSLLEKSGLQMGSYTGEYDAFAAKGNVLRQVPQSGEIVPRGSRVELIASKGEEPLPTPEPDPTPDPNPTPEPISDAPPAPVDENADRTRYFDVGYSVPKDGMPHRIRIDVTDKNGPRSVYDESHNAGEKVKFRVEAVGKPIVIKVYDNDQLSKETSQ